MARQTVADGPRFGRDYLGLKELPLRDVPPRHRAQRGLLSSELEFPWHSILCWRSGRGSLSLLTHKNHPPYYNHVQYLAVGNHGSRF